MSAAATPSAATDLHGARLHRDQGGAGLLSLALIDARNRTLAWLALLDEAQSAEQAPPTPIALQLAPARWLAGHAAWQQERRIARNPQRLRAAALPDGATPPLASIEPRADAWWDDRASSPAERWRLALPDAAATRAYMVDTLETTLELLGRFEHGAASAGAPADEDEGSDPRLHVYRAALFHEDRLVERFAALAQALGVPGAAQLAGETPRHAARAPIAFASRRAPAPAPGGWRPLEERLDDGTEGELLPEFEIDAQVVSWQQYGEFIDDGGYDDRRGWSEAGWRWLEASGRRTPRDVVQWRHGVALNRFGRLLQVPMSAPVLGVSRHEAEAWCRWAGRRLPAGSEWELAAAHGRSRGHVWGEVAEWVLGRAGDASGRAVQRGLPWLAPARLAHPALRSFVEADSDDGFVGFRSCAM